MNSSLLFVTLLCLVGLCYGQTKPQIAFIFDGPVLDVGWTFAHNQGRLYLQRQGYNVTSRENVNPAESQPIVEDLISSGYDLIILTSFTFYKHVTPIADNYTDVLFVIAGGGNTYGKNVAAANPANYQPRYLTGYLSGLITTSNKVGYIAPSPFSGVLDGINAFAIGMKRANPSATLYVGWTQSFSNPDLASEGARQLIQDYDCDIIAQHFDGIEPQNVARMLNKTGIGYSTDMSNFVGQSVLTSILYNWGVVYEKYVQDMINGTWNAKNQTVLYWGLREGITNLADYSPRVPANVRALVDNEKTQIINGNDTVFCGPEVVQFNPQGANGCLSEIQTRTFRTMIDFAVSIGNITIQSVSSSMEVTDDELSLASSVQLPILAFVLLVLSAIFF